mgnify:CR=1 FL=1
MNIERLKKFPHTNIGKMIGDINNLDWMDFEKLKHDIAFGYSSTKNIPFLVIKYQIELRKNIYVSNVQCFLLENNKWKSNNNTIHFLNPEYELNYHQLKLIETVLDGKIEILKECHFPESPNYTGKRIATPGTWRRKRAVEKIERNWIICRYDPRYKMCEEVLMHNIEEARAEYLNSISS